MATTTTIFSPSREAARANAAKQAEFVLSRRQQEREAALRRVRCSFTRRGKWTKSQYPKEIDRDVARIVVGSGRRFLIVRRARKALIAKRRALAGPVLASFLTRHFRRRAELARLLQNRRQVAASYLANRWLAWHESKKRRRVEAAAEIVEFLCRARARRQARGEAAKRISASKAIGRWGKECAARLKWARRRRRACFSIQRATRVELRRRVRAATRIEGAHRARLARERRRVLAYQRYQDTIANVIIRSVRVALAKGRSRAILDERRRRAAACALAGATIALVYCARLREKRRAVEVVAQQNQAAGRLTTFARGIIAKAWRRRIVYARDALLAAELIQRVWRGYVGRKRFAKIKSEAFRCRRCDNMEWGGRYCKQCGFARYEQPVVQIEYGDSPYAPPRVRPSFVNKMRSRIAAAKKRAAERSLFLGKSSTLGPETTSGGNELGVEDARIAADAERLARLALQQSKKMTKGTIPPERSDDLLILSGAAKNLRSVVKAKGRKAAKKQEAYLEHYCSILQSASNSRT